MKPFVYTNKRGETVMSYFIFKELKLDAILRAIARR